MQSITNRFVSALDSGKITDHGKGRLTFKNGLVLNSGKPMRDGLRYDIESLDTSSYTGKLFASHEYDNLTSMLGVLEGVTKQNGQLVASGVQFAIANPQGKLAYEMTREGYINEVSIGTMGMPANEDGVYEHHELYETSLVLIPNDPRAVVNSPLVQAVANGIDITAFTATNDQPEKVEETTQLNEDETVSKTTNDAPAPDAPVVAPAPEQPATEPTATVEEQVNSAVEAALNKLTEKFEASTNAGPVVERTSSVTPSVSTTSKTDAIKNMHAGDRLREQILIMNNRRATTADFERLDAINKIHAEEIAQSDNIDETYKSVTAKAASGMFTNNPHTTTDQLTGIVLPATVVEGLYDVQTSYDGLLGAFPYMSTDSTLFEYRFLSEKMQLAWLAAREHDGADGNLKPLTSVGIKKELKQMPEYAGVLILSDWSIRTGGVNLLNEVRRQLPEAEAKIKAEKTIATFERAVEQRVAGATIDGFVVAADAAGSVAFSAAAASEKDTALAFNDYTNANDGELTDAVVVMNKQSAQDLRFKMGVGAVIGLNKEEIGEDPMLSRVVGHTVITVPNTLMPSIHSAATTTVTDDAGAVTVDHASFFLDRSNWDGKQYLGGSQLDVLPGAAYEIGGNTYSGAQRDETVVRAYGFATSHVRDFRYITGLQSNA